MLHGFQMASLLCQAMSGQVWRSSQGEEKPGSQKAGDLYREMSHGSRGSGEAQGQGVCSVTVSTIQLHYYLAEWAILAQPSGFQGLPHLCTFFSRKLTHAECNYKILNQELLAIKAAFQPLGLAPL